MSSSKENTRTCCVCGSSPSGDPSITLHRFPKPGPRNSLRCETWAKYCFPNEAYASLKFQNEVYLKHKMLCSKHFRSTCFVDKKLFRTAIPDVECDKCSSVPFVPGPSIFEPIAGPSRIIKPFGEYNAVSANPSMDIELNKNFEKLVSESNKAKVQLDILKKKMKNRANKIYRLQKTIKHLNNESFLNALCNNKTINDFLHTKVNPTFVLLLQNELQNYKRKTTGRRWNTESKVIALRLYKRSPTCYKLLRRMICLPAPGTLKSLLTKFKMTVGVNEKILKVLKQTTKNLASPEECDLILMWDEMSIRKHLWYNPKEELIEGFQDHATQGRSLNPASYALVFMIVGIRKNFKQPIAYYLSSGSVTAERLVVLIKEVLMSCFDAGLNIFASVCDMDGVNRKALCVLGASVESPFIKVGPHKIITIFDTPHLLKCFRNLFLKYDIKFMMNISSENKQGIGIAKWAHIRQFYELDNSNPNFVYAPSLTMEHLDPNSKQKMKVKLAAQVLSHSVAGGMYAKVTNGEMSTEALATANLVSLMDNLFDAVNAYTPYLRRGKKLSTNLKATSDHLKHFQKMVDTFKNMTFIGCRGNPPSKDGWIWTINGITMIWRDITFKHKNIKSLSTRRLQQDPLENLFGCIRNNCGSNPNPTVGQFIAALKTSIMSNLPYTGSGNCEKDENEPIIKNFKKLFSETIIHVDDEYKMLKDQDMASSLEKNLEKGSLSEIQACAYVCGFIIKNNKNKCSLCKQIFVTETQEEIHNFIEFKNYESVKNSLIFATRDLVNFIENSATIINTFLEKEAHERNLKIRLSSLLKNSVNYDFLKKCEEHAELNLEYLINSVFHICVNRYCIIKNRIFRNEASTSALKRKMNIVLHK